MGPITDAHKLTYQRNVELAVQQMKSRFEPGFTYHADLKGRLANLVELVGATTAIIDGNRGGDTPNIDNQIEPVWCVPHQIEWGKLIEKEDAIKALTDYESPFVQAGAKAIVRGRDTIFAAALLGNRLIGQDGATASAYANANSVAATVGSSNGATSCGMNVKKVLRGKRYLQAVQVDVDVEELYLALNAQGIEELYGDITYINTQYRGQDTVPAVLNQQRQVLWIAGVTITPADGSAAIADVDGTHYGAVLWCKSTMHYGDFDPLYTRVEPNPAKKYRLHPYMENWFGATRWEDLKVIKLSNDKTAGAA